MQGLHACKEKHFHAQIIPLTLAAAFAAALRAVSAADMVARERACVSVFFLRVAAFSADVCFARCRA